MFALLVSAAGSASHCVRVRVRGKCIVDFDPPCFHPKLTGVALTEV